MSPAPKKAEPSAPLAGSAINLFLEHANVATLLVLLNSLVAVYMVVTNKINIEQYLAINGGQAGLLGIGRGLASKAKSD